MRPMPSFGQVEASGRPLAVKATLLPWHWPQSSGVTRTEMVKPWCAKASGSPFPAWWHS